jgi:hypothetical protein
LNIYSKRLKIYKNNKQRKFENKLFRNNEKLFYKNLADNKTQINNGLPNINEIKEFWSNIWSNEVQFNNQAEWILQLENEIHCCVIFKIDTSSIFATFNFITTLFFVMMQFKPI